MDANWTVFLPPPSPFLEVEQSDKVGEFSQAVTRKITWWRLHFVHHNCMYLGSVQFFSLSQEAWHVRRNSPVGTTYVHEVVQTSRLINSLEIRERVGKKVQNLPLIKSLEVIKVGGGREKKNKGGGGKWGIVGEKKRVFFFSHMIGGEKEKERILPPLFPAPTWNATSELFPLSQPTHSPWKFWYAI